MHTLCPSMFHCPIPPALNAHAAAVDRRTTQWLDEQRLLSPRAKARWSTARYGWLPSRCHPRASFEDLALVADWYAWLFVFDDLGDDSGLGATPDELLRRGRRFLALLSTPSMADEDGDPFERALRAWRRRLAARPNADVWMPRFLASVDEYFSSLAWEASNRAAGILPTVESYQRMRVDTGAVKTAFRMGELLADVRLPEAIWCDPRIAGLATMANHIVCFVNDVVSSPKEKAVGDVHNYVTLLQHHHGLSLTQSIAAVVDHHDREMRAFLAACAELPNLGDAAHNAALDRYAAMLRCWVRANLDWSFECGRYGDGIRSLQALGPALTSSP